MVVRRQAHSCELWVDGVLRQSDTFLGDPIDAASNIPLELSYEPNLGYTAYGSIDAAKVYRRALTAAEIAALYLH